MKSCLGVFRALVLPHQTSSTSSSSSSPSQSPTRSSSINLFTSRLFPRISSISTIAFFGASYQPHPYLGRARARWERSALMACMVFLRSSKAWMG